MTPNVLVDASIVADPAKRYHSSLLSIGVHITQTVVIFGLALALVLR